MSDIIGFHSQLASIMEVLANTAVAEICKLVDDGYAVLRWEMSQSQKENEDLKRKLRKMELKMSKGCSEKTRARGSPVNNQKGGTDEGTLEGSSVMNEVSKEDWGNKGRVKIVNERAVESGPSGNEKIAVVEKETSPGKSAEELGDENGSRCSVWEVSGLETALKAEPDKESVNQRPQLTGTDHRAESVNSLSSEYTMCERSSHLGTLFTQGSTDPETGDASCFHVADMDSEVQSIVPAETNTASSLSSLAALDVKTEAVIDSVPIKLEADMQFSWNKETTSRKVHTQPRYCSEDGDKEEIQPETVTSSFPSHNKVVARGNTGLESDTLESQNHAAFTVSDTAEGQHSVDTGQRGFICKYCGKSFSRLKKFEEHQRVHTGEKPFSCVHCGKQFTQSCNLKMHQSIHTGKRPFPCTQCGKSFMSSRDLKVHYNVHTGERPFCCMACGRSFSHPSNLKRHQRRCSPKKSLSYPLGLGTVIQ